MKKSNFKLLDHTADIAIRVQTNTLEELFANSALALKEISISGKSTHLLNSDIKVTANSMEEALVNFLSEINHLIIMKNKVINNINSIFIKSSQDKIILSSDIQFEIFNPAIHQFKKEIKAITFHKLKIKNKNAGYSVIITLDV